MYFKLLYSFLNSKFQRKQPTALDLRFKERKLLFVWCFVWICFWSYWNGVCCWLLLVYVVIRFRYCVVIIGFWLCWQFGFDCVGCLGFWLCCGCLCVSVLLRIIGFMIENLVFFGSPFLAVIAGVFIKRWALATKGKEKRGWQPVLGCFGQFFWTFKNNK